MFYTEVRVVSSHPGLFVWCCSRFLLLLPLSQTVVSSAISSGDTTEFQTFDVGVHANEIRLVPKFTRLNESVSIKEVL